MGVIFALILSGLLLFMFLMGAFYWSVRYDNGIAARNMQLLFEEDKD